MAMNERRRHRRVPFVSKVTYVLTDSFQYYYSQDLSLGGMFLETRKPFKVGTRLDLDFELPDTEARIRVKGEVVRIVPPDPLHRDQLPGMGITFTAVTPDSQSKLEDFLKGA
ncbi:MAG TPA: TIGR02266 family protein [bacterium]|nr:TIGR02266 family protein [bacterium]